MLDLGTGAGGGAVAFAEEGARVVALEYHATGVGLGLAVARADEAGVVVRFVQGDGRMLPLATGTFEVVFCNQVVEHVQDYQTMLMEAYRVLKPGGVAYVATGNRMWPIEGHSFLLFAGWLPPKVAELYVKILRRRSWSYEWDVWPLFPWQLSEGLRSAGFRIEAAANRFTNPARFARRAGRVLKALNEKHFGWIAPFWPAVTFVARKVGT